MALVTSVEKLSITLTAGGGSIATAISASDTTKCVPFISYRCSTLPPSSYDRPTHLMVDVEFLTSPNRVQVSTSVDTTRVVEVEVCVVEFSSEATVQTGTFALTAGTDLTEQ